MFSPGLTRAVIPCVKASLPPLKTITSSVVIFFIFFLAASFANTSLASSIPNESL